MIANVFVQCVGLHEFDLFIVALTHEDLSDNTIASKELRESLPTATHTCEKSWKPFLYAIRARERTCPSNCWCARRGWEQVQPETFMKRGRLCVKSIDIVISEVINVERVRHTRIVEAAVRQANHGEYQN